MKKINSIGDMQKGKIYLCRMEEKGSRKQRLSMVYKSSDRKNILRYVGDNTKVSNNWSVLEF